MKAFLATTCIVTGALLAGGCATKEIRAEHCCSHSGEGGSGGRPDSRNGQQIEDTRNQVKQVDEKAQSGISAAQERAISRRSARGNGRSARRRSHEQRRPGQPAGRKETQELNSLRDVVANIDDYKLQTSVAVPFAFNKYDLTDDAKADLDKLAGEVKSDRRFFIAVEGYTDSDRVESLQRSPEPPSRGHGVVEYLVAKHDIPIYRIHMIGLGQEKPVDEAQEPHRARQEPPRRSEGLQRRSGHHLGSTVAPRPPRTRAAANPSKPTRLN